MRAAFTDAAIGNDFVFAGYALRAVKLLELIRALEGAVFVGCLCPRHVRGGGDMAGALRGFAHTGRRNDFPREFVNRSHVHQVTAIAILDDGEDIFLASAE